ncbi:hypothetical protein DFH05DRAFT_1393651 [Lentinula detonsa]|uniref:Yeast cell wall synthesis Kre9/Knh1-like N-terminal domain-containing protein n=2 Tax=Lentinula detonsa TaxID=2804962 RepID=A0A9W8TZR1_9AGAR|nr:hypothetical protein DFH05DRAFT_1393651 [Lentinula detonsa]
MLTFTISCFFFSLVRALPTLLSRDVYDPPITSPAASTVWEVGQTVTVTWDTTNLPPASQLTDPNGTVVLGYMTSPTDSEHLMIDSPLAQDFPLSDGQVSFTVPSVVTRTDYIIALFGDSGNISPTFTIQGTDTSSSASTTSSSAIPTSASTSTLTPSTSVTSSESSVSTGSTVATESEASSITTTPTSEGSPTNTVTNVVTVSFTSGSSTTVSSSFSILSSSSVSSLFASETSTASSSSATEAAASSNGAGRPGTLQCQVYAFIVAGLLAACLL